MERGQIKRSATHRKCNWQAIALLTLSWSGAFALESSAQEALNSIPLDPRNSLGATPTPPNRPILKRDSRGAEVAELQAALKLLGYYTGTVDGVYGESTAIAVSLFQTAAGLNADGITGTATWNRLFPPDALTTATTAPLLTSATTRTPTATAANFPIPTATKPLTPSSSPSSAAPIKSGSASPVSETSAPVDSSSVELPILRIGMRGPAVVRLQERLQTAGFFRGSLDGIFGPETQAAVKAAQQSYSLEADGVVGPATWRFLLR